ncbi:hypothetical protein BDD12DRAFT_902430 [Trichophaea hybrida]|nr:hypothetical protein BDD12DRAFT_902430 [Trichophaea hybrida]
MARPVHNAIGKQVTTDGWVGPITVVLKIWRLDASRAVRAVGPVPIIHPSGNPNPVIQITDIITPVHRTGSFDSSREWPLDLDTYRDYLSVGIAELAQLRELDLLRPREAANGPYVDYLEQLSDSDG